MTFEEWLDMEQTVSSRRDRLEHFAYKDLGCSQEQAERLLGWLAGAWNAGTINGLSVERDILGKPAVKPLTAR